MFSDKKPGIPHDLRRRRMRCRAGVKCWEKRRCYKACLPSVIMGNVGSLTNKMEKLSLLIKVQCTENSVCFFSFTETRLNEAIPSSLVTLDGFQLVGADRLEEVWSNPKKGGHLAFMNFGWYNTGHIAIKNSIAQRTLNFWPLVWAHTTILESSHVIMISVYAAPSLLILPPCVKSSIQTQRPPGSTPHLWRFQPHIPEL